MCCRLYLAELDEGRVHDRHEVFEADVAAEARNFVHELHDGDLGPRHLRHVANLYGKKYFVYFNYVLFCQILMYTLLEKIHLWNGAQHLRSHLDLLHRQRVVVVFVEGFPKPQV